MKCGKLLSIETKPISKPNCLGELKFDFHYHMFYLPAGPSLVYCLFAH